LRTTRSRSISSRRSSKMAIMTRSLRHSA
jgi:hypothetical protein